MLKQLSNKLFQYQKVAGLEIFLKGNDEFDLHLIILERKKKALRFEKRVLFLNGLENLNVHVEPNIPISLVINGKGILHKKVERIPDEIEAIPATVLPNAQAADFCYQLVSSDDGYWVSIIRLNVVISLVQDISKMGFSVVQLSLGVFPVEYLLPLLEEHNLELNTGYFSLNLQNEHIHSFDTNEEIFPSLVFIGEEPLKNLLLTAFGGAFQVLMKVPFQIFNIELIKQSEEDFRYKQLFKKVGWILLFSLFGILLVNFVAFTWLEGMLKKQNIELTYHQNQLDKLNQIKQEFQEQHSFFDQNKLLRASKASFYADQIALFLPVGIQLQEIKIFPSHANQQQWREKQFLFDKSSIRIKGQSKQSIILNNWIKGLERLDWVHQVKVLPYSETNKGIGEFELELQLNYEE